MRDSGVGHTGFRLTDGLGLVWLAPWDGKISLKPSDLDPYYIEICRRVRLVVEAGRLQARFAGSKVPRVAQFEGGATGSASSNRIKLRQTRFEMRIRRSW
jgi:CRISPR system Cascade subunit CasA